jgi:hypothetical protein
MMMMIIIIIIIVTIIISPRSYNRGIRDVTTGHRVITCHLTVDS